MRDQKDRRVDHGESSEESPPDPHSVPPSEVDSRMERTQVGRPRRVAQGQNIEQKRRKHLMRHIQYNLEVALIVYLKVFHLKEHFKQIITAS